MTYKQLYEKLKEFAQDKEYAEQEVDVYFNGKLLFVDRVTEDGFLEASEQE